MSGAVACYRLGETCQRVGCFGDPCLSATELRPWTLTDARRDADDLAAELAADMADEARTAQGDYDDERPTLAEVDRDEWAARDE